MLGNLFETPVTNRTSSCWGTTSRARHRQQIVHLSAGAPLQDQDTGNKSYILVLGHHFETKTRQQTKTPTTNHTSSCWGTTSRPRHRQQIVHFSAGAPLRDHDTSNKSCISVLGTTSRPRHRQQLVHLSAGTSRPRHQHQIVYLRAGHHFETKTQATKRTSLCWSTTSKTPATKHTS